MTQHLFYRIKVQRPFFFTYFPGKAQRNVCDVTDRDQDSLKYCQNTWAALKWQKRPPQNQFWLHFHNPSRLKGDSNEYYIELPKNNYHFKHTSYILRFIITTIIHIWRFKKLCSILSFASARWTWTEGEKKLWIKQCHWWPSVMSESQADTKDLRNDCGEPWGQLI